MVYTYTIPMSFNKTQTARLDRSIRCLQTPRFRDTLLEVRFEDRIMHCSAGDCRERMLVQSESGFYSEIIAITLQPEKIPASNS